jgi:hypothetical protein
METLIILVFHQDGNNVSYYGDLNNLSSSPQQ